MKWLLFATVSVLTFSAMAEETLKVPVEEGFAPFKMEEQPEEYKPKKQKQVMHISCQDASGREIKKSDPAYQTCLQKAHDQLNKDGHKVNFGFGDED
ncbi:hypothetical protein [Bdellovibrio sp. NC01]|uniref:hypothetical protein n=1 Tax=Bdellovibrio sp. NC01 TaxID=2220073 RepID=UPI00115BA65A|nr:hypothetical protein [Bdellovibrio sp. NC01]QDK36807.1 hypothetical protein DOE51_03945 [Bdellovibrio sp. NC01]